MKKTILLISIIVVISGIVALAGTENQAKKYYRLLPSNVKTNGTYYANTHRDWYKGSCGLAAYNLSGETVKKIKADGLVFFTSISKSKDSAKSDVSVEQSMQWKKTPLPHASLSNGLGPAFSPPCAYEPEDGWNRKILQAYSNPGNYYSNTSQGSFLVIPSMSLIVFYFYK